MTRAARSPQALARGLPDRREIGPVGTAARLVAGLIAVALPIALGGFGWWDAGAALIALPLIATGAAALIAAAYTRLAPAALARRHAICSGPACWLIAVMAGTAVTIEALTPASGEVAFWVWLGASTLLAAARGDGGCEVLAAPNLITGRRDQIGCILFTPIDRAEAGPRRKHVPAAGAGATHLDGV